VKRSVRDESTWVLTHLYMKAMLGISLYSKNTLSSLLCYVFSSTKSEIRAEQDLPGSKGGWGKGWRRGAGGRNDPNNVWTCE
jgi:hypothetical protein